LESKLPNGAKIVQLSDESETWLSDSINGKLCDAIVYDFPFAATEIENSNLKIKIAKLPNSDIGYKIGLRKGNERLRNELNSAIRKIKELPQYANLLKVYLPIGNVVVPRNVGNNPTHKVENGDTLSNIALTHLGKIERWNEIQSLNNIPNPHLISIGQILIMPTDYR
jgi:nucleoid-associated protein YgaU